MRLCLFIRDDVLNRYSMSFLLLKINCVLGRYSLDMNGTWAYFENYATFGMAVFLQCYFVEILKGRWVNLLDSSERNGLSKCSFCLLVVHLWKHNKSDSKLGTMNKLSVPYKSQHHHRFCSHTSCGMYRCSSVYVRWIIRSIYFLEKWEALREQPSYNWINKQSHSDLEGQMHAARKITLLGHECTQKIIES